MKNKTKLNTILLIIIFLLIVGLVYLLLNKTGKEVNNIQDQEKNTEISNETEKINNIQNKEKDTEIQNETEKWETFSNLNIPISFSYPMSWGIPRIFEEGDESEYSKETGQPEMLKGKFLIDFPASPIDISIEGLNSSYELNLSDEIYEDWNSCAFSYKEHMKGSIPEISEKLSSGVTVVYSINNMEAENRVGLFGDALVNSNKKFPWICATITLGNPAMGYKYESSDFTKVKSEIWPANMNEWKNFKTESVPFSFFGKILPVKYLKNLNQGMNAKIETFEKFANSIKVK